MKTRTILTLIVLGVVSASAWAGSSIMPYISPYARTFLDDATEAAFKATVNLEIGTDVQAYDADLTTLAGSTAWRLFYSNGTSVITELVLGADGTFLESNGASAAPAFRTLVDGDVPNNITIDLATLASTVTYADNENAAETNAIVFLPGGDLDGGNLAPEVDGDFHYNPSTGTAEATAFTEGGVAVINNDEMDASSELLAIIDDEVGEGLIMFGGDQQSYIMAGQWLHLMADPLVMCLPITPATTEQDLSFENHDATYQAVETADQVAEGLVWTLNLDADEYLTHADHADFTLLNGSNDADCTFIAVVKIYDDANIKTIMAKYDDTNSQLEWELFVDAAEKINFRSYDESAGNTAYEGRITDAAVSAGIHLIHVTCNAGSQGESASDGYLIYVDGAVVASSASDGGGTYVDREDKGQAVWIGAQGENDAYGNGWVGDIAAWAIDQNLMSPATIHEFYIATRGYYAQ